jgi:hypothetical protein
VNDTEFAMLKAKLEALGERWVDTLRLNTWEISYLFDRDSGHFIEQHGECAAECVVKWQYMHAGIYFNMLELLELDDRKIEIIFVHELMHIFLKELRKTDDGMEDHEERVAQMLTMAMLSAREASP